MTSLPDTTVAAVHAAESPLLLERADQVARAAKRWRNCSTLGVDTEFVRERTYHANLGLVQVSDGKSVWLIDPLKQGTLEPLAHMLACDTILKVFHSPSEDLEVLLHVCGVVPEPLIDTQQACAMLGQPLQLGYHAAAQWLMDVQVEKELTRSNWCARPLEPDLLRYAALDVCLLPLMNDRLQRRLEDAGRSEWLAEDCARMVENARQPVRPRDSWQRIRGHGRLDAQSLAVLRALAAWREKEARRRNRPRGFIIPDPVLLTIAHERLGRSEDFDRLTDLHPRARKRYAKPVAALVNRVTESGDRLEPERTLRPAEKKLVSEMRDASNLIAQGLKVESALLVTKREMIQLVLAEDDSDIPERLTGWRRPIVTEPLLELKG